MSTLACLLHLLHCLFWKYVYLHKCMHIHVFHEYDRLCVFLCKPRSASTQFVCKLHPDFKGDQFVQNFATYTQINTVFMQETHETGFGATFSSRAVARPTLNPNPKTLTLNPNPCLVSKLFLTKYIKSALEKIL